jgi:S1-C subfamily serine protease
MGLVIKFLSQPNAGEEIKFGDDKGVITFGRAADADVGFPSEMDIVSRDHFRLQRELGAYKFVISREKPVFANGRPILDGEELDEVMQIQLSGPNGPRLRIERTDGALGNMPKTRVLARGQDIGDFAEETKTGGRRLRNALGAAALAIAAIAAGVYYLNKDVQTTQGQVAETQGQVSQVTHDVAATQAKVAETQAQVEAVAKEVSALNEKLPSMEEAVQNLGKKTDLAALIRQNKESVYLVAVMSPMGEWIGRGTAWAVEMPDGTRALATNSHVAEMFDEIGRQLPADSYMVAIQPKGPDYKRLKVTRVKLHPGFHAFQKVLLDLMEKQKELKVRKFDFILGYDVALLFVEDPAQIAAPLKLAPPESYNALTAGEEAYLIGHPAEGTPGTDWMRPEPNSQAGIITGVTTFFLARGEDADNQLVQHSLAGSGGASGSPIFNARGEVVALHSAGSFKFLEIAGQKDPVRVDGGARIQYAQRVDMLRELIDGTADAKLPEHQKAWAAGAAAFMRTPDQLLATWVQLFRELTEPKPGITKIGDFSAPMDVFNEKLKARVALFQVKVDKPGQYMFIARSSDGRNIMTNAYDPATGELITLGQGGGPVSFPSPLPKIDEPREVLIAVIDDAAPFKEGEPAQPAATAVMEVWHGILKKK